MIRRCLLCQSTHRAIIDSFWMLLEKKSLDKISVKDIIEIAQINRNTFYYHFEDLYALLDTVFHEEAVKFREESKGDCSFYEEYCRAAGLFCRNRLAIIHVYNSKSREILHRYMKEAADHFVGRFVKEAAEGTGLSKQGLYYITNFYSYAIVGNTMQWVEKGMPEYRKDLLLTISESFEATIDIMIQDYIAHHSQ